MKKLAHIENNKVVNISVWDDTGDWAPPKKGFVVLPDDSPAQIGWTYYRGKFSEPTPEPEVVVEEPTDAP